MRNKHTAVTAAPTCGVVYVATYLDDMQMTLLSFEAGRHWQRPLSSATLWYWIQT